MGQFVRGRRGVATLVAVVGTASAVMATAPVLGAPSSPQVSSGATGQAAASAGAPPPVRTVVPARLRRGVDARVPFLQDGRITAGRTRFRTRLPLRLHQELLGRSGESWLVADGPDRRVRVHLVRPGQPPQLVPRSRLVGGLIGVRASRDGEWLVSSRFERESTSYAVRRVSDGVRVGAYGGSTQLGELPYDAADGHVLMVRELGDLPPRELYAVDWEVGVGERRLGSDVVAGFLRRDVVFVTGAGPRRFGPTSIAEPGVPAWSARFAALDLSPDASLVLGVGPRLVRGRPVLQVRRMSDGAVLQQLSYGRKITKGEYWAFDYQPAQTARFEGNRRFVFEFASGGRAVLVRCTTTGRCVRASRTGGGISFPHERSRWPR